MKFQEACAEVANMAQYQDRVIYLYKDNDEGCWLASHHRWSDWLFKAYPGGRKEMSVKGNEVLQLKTPPNTGLQLDGGYCPGHVAASVVNGFCDECWLPIPPAAAKA